MIIVYQLKCYYLLYNLCDIFAMQDRFYISVPPRLIFIQNLMIIYFILIVNKYKLSDSLLKQIASLILIEPQGSWLLNGYINTFLCTVHVS